MEQEILKSVLKIDLHCHLDGSLSLQHLRQYVNQDIVVSQIQADMDCENLSQYLEKFSVPLQSMQHEQGLINAGYDFIKSVSQEQMRYVEVRFAPMLSVHGNMNPEKVLEAVLEGLEKGRGKYGVDYNVIVCAMRHHSHEDNLHMIQAARNYLGQGVCGADLAGNEAAYPMKNFRNLFTEVKKMGIPFTIHAGECNDAQNIVDAVAVGARRIGHGIAMRGNDALQKLCREQRIGIEMCPISNLQTKAVPSSKEYPLREFIEADLSVTINTDNRTVSNSTLTKEFQFIQKAYGVREHEIEKMISNSIEVSFASDDVKQMLWREHKNRKKGNESNV